MRVGSRQDFQSLSACPVFCSLPCSGLGSVSMLDCWPLAVGGRRGVANKWNGVAKSGAQGLGFWFRALGAPLGPQNRTK